jgi:hypothetical protein
MVVEISPPISSLQYSRPKLMFANPFFHLKISRFKARAHRVAHPHWCKNSFLRSNRFLPQLGVQWGLSLCHITETDSELPMFTDSFYANCCNFITSNFWGTILTQTWQFAVILGSVFADRLKSAWLATVENKFHFLPRYIAEIYVWWAWIHVSNTNPSPVG